MGEAQDVVDTAVSNQIVDLINEGGLLDWQQFINFLPYAVCVIQADNGKILEANKAVSRVFGYEPEQLVGKNFFTGKIIKGDSFRQQIIQGMKSRITRSDWLIPYYWQSQQSRIGNFSFRKVHYKNRLCFLTFCHDVTRLKQSQETLEQQLAFYKTLAEHTQDIAWQMDAEGKIIYVGPGVSQWGYTDKALVGQLFYKFLHPKDLAKVKKGLAIMTVGEAPAGLLRVRFKTRSNEYASVEISASPLFDKHKKLFGVHGIARDISDRIKIEAKLRERASSDQLTGLLNRNAFYRRLDSTLKNRELFNKGVALFFIDVDNFKAINDNMGHNMGDDCLKKIASVIKTTIRDTDSAARIGGDEFAILINPANLYIVKNICKRIKHQVEILCPINELLEQELTISIGVCFAKEKIRTSNLVHSADKAMYTAKQKGKNCYYIMEEHS